MHIPDANPLARPPRGDCGGRGEGGQDPVASWPGCCGCSTSPEPARRRRGSPDRGSRVAKGLMSRRRQIVDPAGGDALEPAQHRSRRPGPWSSRPVIRLGQPAHPVNGPDHDDTVQVVRHHDMRVKRHMRVGAGDLQPGRLNHAANLGQPDRAVYHLAEDRLTVEATTVTKYRPGPPYAQPGLRTDRRRCRSGSYRAFPVIQPRLHSSRRGERRNVTLLDTRAVRAGRRCGDRPYAIRRCHPHPLPCNNSCAPS